MCPFFKVGVVCFVFCRVLDGFMLRAAFGVWFRALGLKVRESISV